MKILVYGAGVLGSLYAARLIESGHSVYLLARDKRATELQSHGIVLQSLTTGERTQVPVNVVEQLRPKDSYDLALILLPKHRYDEVLPVLGANAHIPDILFLGNNAAGAVALCSAVGRQRVLLGFPGASGTRQGHVVHYFDTINGQRLPVTMGELNGAVTPRLRLIASVFQGAGIPVALEPDIDAWLKTHAALILPLAGAYYMSNCDVEGMVRTRDSLVLMYRGIQEGFEVLCRLGVPLVPLRLRLLRWIPEPLFILLAQRVFRRPESKYALIHADAAREEMQHLAQEFSALAARANYAIPLLDFLYEFIQPAAPPIDEGSNQLAVNWRDVWLFIGGLAGIWASFRLWKLRHQPDGEPAGQG
jgi:2-dehydropantoate 2-reductase